MLIPKDKALTVGRSIDTLTIAWKWRWQDGIAFLISGLIFSGALIGASFTPSVTYPERPSPDIGFLVAGIVVLLPFAYASTAFILNRTTIVSDRRRILVTHGPLPFLRRRHDENGTKQFYLKCATQATTSLAGLSLHLVDNNDHDVFLVRNFPSRTAALQAWAQLQDFHGLVDLPVLGETPHSGLLEQREKTMKLD